MINNILISREKRVILHRDKVNIGLEGENLQEVLVFNLDEELEGQGIIEIKFPDGTTGFIEVERTELGYELPIKSSLLTQKGELKMQLRILQEGKEVFKSEIMEFRVKESINATETIPEQYPTWIDNLTTLKQDLEKSEQERVTSEKARIEAETQREETFSQMEQSVEDAVKEIADKKADYNQNALEKTNEYNELAEQKTNAFNSNAETKTNNFNQNATEKTTAFDTDVATKTNEFDTNATNKTTEFNNNAKSKTDAFNSNAQNKVDEYNLNAQEKMDEYNTNAEELTNRITTLESENEELQLECKKLREDNQAIAITGQESGENITLNDSSDARFKKFEISGNSSQETREGYNLLKLDFEKHKDYVTINNDGSFDVKNTSTGNIYPTILNISLKAGTYTFLYEKNSNMPGVFIQRNNDGAYNFYLNSDVKYKQFTFDEDGVFRFEMVVSAGEEIKNVKLMLLKGAYTFDNQPTYEPYGASPSPEYPSPVKTVGQNGSVEIEVCNKNEFDGIMEQGNISGTTGSNVTESACIRSKNYIKIRPSKSYFFEREGKLTDAVGLRFYDKDKNIISSATTTIGYGVKNKIFTTVANAYYMRFTDWTNDLTNKYLLAQSNVATDYIPHESYTKVLPIQKEFVKIGDVEDTFVKVDGKWYEKHYFKKLIMDGINYKINVKTGVTVNNLYYTPIISDMKIIENNSIVGDILCNYFVAKSANDIYGNDKTGIAITTGKSFSFGFGLDSNITTVELANAWLQEKNTEGNPIEVYYLLAEPELIECTEEQSKILDEIEQELHTYKSTTHITISAGEINAIANVEYLKDTQAYIDNQINTLQAMILAGEE